MKGEKAISTIGHSTRTSEEFLGMLKSFKIEQLIDVRRFPGSRKYPHFSKENLEVSIPENNIEYIHLENLGGRRKASQDSLNSVWNHPSFRGYADYMETSEFKKAFKILENMASKKRCL